MDPSDRLPEPTRPSGPRPEPRGARADRLVEVDALRGLAAMAVVLFHFTAHYVTLFAPPTVPGIRIGWGHYGVNLFFIISGFVIFMTLERTTRPMDFVVSRFSRLFPAYWAAIALTFVITHWLGLPGKLVDLPSAIANLSMVHNIFRVPHVDGVYWTLEVELLFYVGMFALYRSGRLHQVHFALLAMLALRLTYVAFERLAGIDLPWTIFRLMILRYIPWFALGICIYAGLNARSAAERHRFLMTAGAAIATLAIAESIGIALLACALGALVLLAAMGRLPLLRHPVLVWLGAVSYPLYLLHENIGWSLLLRLQSLGLHANTAVAVVMPIVLVLVAALHYTVEKPALRWIRDAYKRRQLAARTA
jgi:peptidoglycan/LPS O-acetylase OafA/YrhL